MLWEVDILPAARNLDRLARSVERDASALGLGEALKVSSARGYLIEAPGLSKPMIEKLARDLLSDPVVESARSAAVGDASLASPPDGHPLLVHVLFKPGVMDPAAESTRRAIADLGIAVTSVRTLTKYWISGVAAEDVDRFASRLLANDAIERVITGPLAADDLRLDRDYRFERINVPIGSMDAAALQRLSREGQLHLSLTEMLAVQQHFQQLGRDPTDVELETIAQTWSEHCSHKTLAGRIEYRDEFRQRSFENMLKETIFAATHAVRRRLGEDDWCVSVFRDNAGIVRFDEKFHATFKVETHNHPSALEPYGGANTGVGGVIRDTMGTGLGAKPIAGTDVFCFAPPSTPVERIPPGVLHPRRVIHGVVAGVRDYGNRMGIPTVNGAVCYDRRYLGNPLVFCGSVGIIPPGRCEKEAQADDWIVAVGGRTGRDGIHGATFSSAELTSQSEEISGGAVQIGNAITEKMMLDVLLEARDRGLYHAVTDCGAGGFSSAVGEMGAELGAEVWLERAPLKYDGLSYTEIWISEAQERMVLAVPPSSWNELTELFASEEVEATIIGRFTSTGRLVLKYQEHVVGDLAMDFLHRGRPDVVRQAVYNPPPRKPFLPLKTPAAQHNASLLAILGAANVSSREWIIRQYDHEVQAGSAVKSLVGCDGPSDAAVIRPVLGSRRGLVVSCGINPYYGDFDTYSMAASAIDEAIRNAVAVGADPARIALLDNFCWGNCERSETLGSLVRAALACHDVAIELGCPFISGKDSLNNEFAVLKPDGVVENQSIPPTLLISALGQIDDVSRAVTMDLKQPGNILYQVGSTRNELGGSHYALIQGIRGGDPPSVRTGEAEVNFASLHQAICQGLVRACHDLSEGGLAVAAAEMAFAGDLGLEINLAHVPHDLMADGSPHAHLSAPTVPQAQAESPRATWNPSQPGPSQDAVLLFSESNSRFLCEVEPEQADRFERVMAASACTAIGRVTKETYLRVRSTALGPDASPTSEHAARPESAEWIIDLPVETLRSAWQRSTSPFGPAGGHNP